MYSVHPCTSPCGQLRCTNRLSCRFVEPTVVVSSVPCPYHSRPSTQSALPQGVRVVDAFMEQNGEVAEWSNAPDSKSGLRLCRNVGSNPTLSARNKNAPPVGHFYFSGSGA
jgi:hypothetical protein